jgi:CarD family transcriptional regulator
MTGPFKGGAKSTHRYSADKQANMATSTKTSSKKKAIKDLEFSKGDFVVYPTHGVGKVTGVEDREIAGQKLQLFVVSFEKERMTLRVPIEKVKDSGLRKLSSHKVIDNALKTLKGKVRVKRTMWSRRAQEYEAKINSGDPISIAEVVRDLHRNADQPDQSYSERQMYQAALERLARELAAVEQVEHEAAVEKLETLLSADFVAKSVE